MAKLASLFATLGIGTAVMRPDLAHLAWVAVFASTMMATAAIGRQRAYHAGNRVIS
ncbi:hypothetical protein [Sphingomonas quercus]|uniref:Uncharacterized protein n=1 Tax=Sphingomonas quercus TaxID=2842451 RepID=A0ABS6BEA9_9SPHN|nr:hypothetical protein [Sphingomonas quercus]MBU3076649.1 hypothetical protein [Sphingomonas quercus]